MFNSCGTMPENNLIGEVEKKILEEEVTMIPVSNHLEALQLPLKVLCQAVY